MMSTFRFLIFLSVLSILGCETSSTEASQVEWKVLPDYGMTKGPLLTTKFQSFEELKSVVDIEYFEGSSIGKKAKVELSHACTGQKVTSVLSEGITDLDIKRAGYGSIWARVSLCFKSPYLVLVRNDLIRVHSLARKRGEIFGGDDLAFYNIAEKMVDNISDENLSSFFPEDISEKGYINTFNHVTAQAIMTTLFSEKFTDFIADTHERGNMPELVSGKFSKEQLLDRDRGPVDNYIDIVNNEWGQELGKVLKEKYSITRQTQWTAALLASYLNDVQSYYSWAMQISFKPFRSDELFVKQFAKKLNVVMGKVPKK